MKHPGGIAYTGTVRLTVRSTDNDYYIVPATTNPLLTLRTHLTSSQITRDGSVQHSRLTLLTTSATYWQNISVGMSMAQNDRIRSPANPTLMIGTFSFAKSL